MELSQLVPFQQANTIVRRGRKNIPNVAQAITDNRGKNILRKAFKLGALALGFAGNPGYINNDRANFEAPEFDLERIQMAIDTDSYVKQSFRKYRELFWKEGWEIVSENDEAVDYLWHRLDFLEAAMKETFQEFLAQAIDQLCKYSNVFILKRRDKTGTLKRVFPGRLYLEVDEDPIIGYEIIPTEKVEILRDRHNKPRKYRQRIDADSINDDMSRYPTWKAEDVIHLHLEKKPGHAFGTPLILSALDDIIALRQVEEDIQNMVHRELFPLYKYKIGSEDYSARPEDIDRAASEIESLRVEGGLILPFGHDVEVVGAEGKALEAQEYLAHFKERVAVGLGLFPHHLGMVSAGANKDMTDRLDIALYEKIKDIQRYVAEAIRIHVFNDLLVEGGFDPFVNPQIAGESDRCMFKFNEIDADTKIKKETHIVNLWANDIIDLAETRYALKLDPDVDESELHAAMAARMVPKTTQTTTGATGTKSTNVIDVTPDAAVSSKQQSSTGGKPNPKNNKKGPGNIVRPTNQFGTKMSPSVRHSDMKLPNWLEEVEELLDDEL